MPNLLVSMPICSHATSIEQSVAFKCLFDLWKSDYSSQSFITNIGTDGDGMRRSVLHNLCDETLHVPYYRSQRFRIYGYGNIASWDHH